MGQMGCLVHCARALVDHAVSCMIAPDRAVDTILGAISGHQGPLGAATRGLPLGPGARGAKKKVFWIYGR